MPNKFEKIKESPSVEKGPLGKFREMLEGWMTCEGGDYCPDCWEKYLDDIRKKPLEEFDVKIHKGGGVFKTSEENKDDFLWSFQKNAKPTAQKDIAKSRKILDGYRADCAKCRKVVFVPKEEKK